MTSTEAIELIKRRRDERIGIQDILHAIERAKNNRDSFIFYLNLTDKQINKLGELGYNVTGGFSYQTGGISARLFAITWIDAPTT